MALTTSVRDPPRQNERTPHVCFKVELPSDKGSDGGLPEALKCQLKSRVDSVRMFKIWFSGPWVLRVHSRQHSFPTMLGKSRYSKDEWVLIVSPPRVPTVSDKLFRRKARDDVEEVMGFCRAIDASLNAIPGVTAVRWYFEGAGKQSPAVNTPDELPWAHG